jgi:tetratricopeptide (TPR) repeat protein
MLVTLPIQSMRSSRKLADQGKKSISLMTTPDSPKVQVVPIPRVSEAASADIQTQYQEHGNLTERIDHILFTEWDPIGVHLLTGFDCADEYRSYMPTIVDLVTAGASYSEISDQLMVFEGYIKGEDLSQRRRCDVIAVMVSRYGPHYAESPFIPAIQTDTPDAAYRSVLDLVTQTRLDTYEANWEAVRVGYEQAVTVCQMHLKGHDQLLAACLNNLGQAHTHLGQLEKAQALLEAAVPLLATYEATDEIPYLRCLDNLITNFEQCGKFSEAEPCLQAMVACLERTADDGDERTSVAINRLASLRRTDASAISLRCSRISVAGEGYGEIRHVVVLD